MNLPATLLLAAQALWLPTCVVGSRGAAASAHLADVAAPAPVPWLWTALGTLLLVGMALALLGLVASATTRR